MKVAKILVLCFFFLSCKTQFLNFNFPSKYMDVKDNRFSIQFKTDSSFVIHGWGFKNPYGCTGKWRAIGDHKILLRCDDVKDPLLVLEPGYMKNREHIIEILSNERIKYENRILKLVH